MRVYAVTSIHVQAEELSRRQERYDRISPPGVTVELHDLGPTAPQTLETAEDVRTSARLVAEALRAADDAGYDALLPDCPLDPGVDEVSGTLTTPVHGQLQLTLDEITAAAGAVTMNEVIAATLATRAAAHGTELVATSVLDLDHTMLSADTRWLAALGTAVNELADAGAEVVINGCATVELDNARSGRIPVVDPAVTALRRLRGAHESI